MGDLVYLVLDGELVYIVLDGDLVFVFDRVPHVTCVRS